MTSHSSSFSPRGALARTLACTLILGLLGAPIATAAPEPSASSTSHSSSSSTENKSVQDRALDQSLAASQPVATERTEISAGHVDMGPHLNNGHFELMIHDDHDSTPVWRSMDSTLYRGSSAALRTVPEDSRYSFVGAPAGSQVYVIPQTEAKGVIWPGWNAQDPQLVPQLKRGVTLTLESVQGPGQFSLYVENGNFSAPQLLWSSATKDPQPIWVEKNSHVHANWVFTQPGLYHLKITASAELNDGTTVSDSRILSIVLGDEMSTDQAFSEADKARASLLSSASSAGNPSVSSDHNAAAQNTAAQGEKSADSASTTPLIIGAGAVLAALGALAVYLRRKSLSAQRQAATDFASAKKSGEK